VGSVTRSDVTLSVLGTRINEILDVSTSKRKNLSPILKHDDLGSLAGLSGFHTRQEIELFIRHEVQTGTTQGT
jgi:hypothetical protein